MRIRTLKPEWLEDEVIAAEADPIRVLSVGLILMADDYGRGRASSPFVRSTVWPYQDPPESLGKITERLQRLAGIGFIRLYKVADQSYYEICKWAKHQKVSHPGKPLVPLPPEDSGESPESLRPDHDHDREKTDIDDPEELASKASLDAAISPPPTPGSIEEANAIRDRIQAVTPTPGTADTKDWKFGEPEPGYNAERDWTEDARECAADTEDPPTPSS